MAGNNSIQILRSANLAASANKTQVPLAGQPLYDEATRRLYVGDGTATAENLSAIVASHSATTNRVTAHYGEVAANESGHSIDITSSSGSLIRINSANMVDILGNLGLNIRTNMIHTNLNISAAAANSNIYLRSGHTTVLMGGNILATDVSNVNISASYFRVDASSGSNLTVSTDAVLNAARRLSLNGTYANIEASDAIFVQSFSPTTGMSNITLNGPSINIAGTSIRLNGANGNYISIGGAISMSSYSTSIAGYQFNVSTSLTNISSSKVCISGANGVNINAYPLNIYSNGVTINQSGNIITFPSANGIVALTSQAWVPTYWTENRTWIEIDASTSCAAYNGFYYEQPGSEKRFAIDGRLFGKDEMFFSCNTANLATAYDNMAYGFVTVEISMNAVAYNAGNVGQVHTITTGEIPIFFHPIQQTSTQYYGRTQTFNPNSTAWNASQSYSNVVEFVPYIDARMQEGALLLVPKISYLHGPSRVLNVIIDSVINCTLSGGYIMARADK